MDTRRLKACTSAPEREQPARVLGRGPATMHAPVRAKRVTTILTDGVHDTQLVRAFVLKTSACAACGTCTAWPPVATTAHNRGARTCMPVVLMSCHR